MLATRKYVIKFEHREFIYDIKENKDFLQINYMYYKFMYFVNYVYNL